MEEFAKKASAYRESGKAEAYKKKAAKVQKMQDLADSKARNIPRAIALADGAVQRYADADSNFAVARDGDTYIIYDYATGNVTRDMTRAEVDAALGRYRRSRAGSETPADANAKNENTSENLSSDKSSAESRKITAEMSESERYEALKGRVLENVPAVSALSASVVEKIPEISSWEDINRYLGSKKRSIIQKIAVEFGSIGKEYFNKDVQLSFVFSNNNFNETYKKQQINYEEFAKMFSVFDAVIENAVGVEVHKRTDYKPDPTLENVFVLMSAYQDGDSIIPVKLEVKKFKDKKNTLYVAISLNKIKKTEVLGRGNTENGVTQQPRSVTISIAKIFEKINPSDKSFLKYIPDGFLNAEQLKAKQEAIREDRKKVQKNFADQLPMEEKAKPTAKQVKAAMEAKAQAAAIESLAKEKIKDYADLSKENQSMIRKVLREAMASGISEADALSYARVAARSGLDITFDKKACYKGKNKAGEDVYHAGYYDPENNRIVINPETKRKHASLLIHELSHAVRSYIGKDGKRHAVPMIDDPDKISDAMWEKIAGYYADQEITVERAELMADEASAYYAEQMLGTDAAIDLLLGEKPTLKQKILSFFKKSAQDYSSDEALSRESRKFLRNFKKTFDAFAARNQGRNAESKASNSEIRASMDIDNMTEEQYNSFGWARRSEAITKKELDDLYSKVNTKKTLRSFKRSSRGEAIVEVNNDPNRTLGTNNVFAFLKGTKNKFEIARVVRFDAQTEAEMDTIREDIYEGRSCNDTHIAFYQKEGIAREYRREDFSTFDGYRKRRSNRKASRGADRDNRGSVKYGSGYSLRIGEDGEIIEKNDRRYAMEEEPSLPRTAGTMSVGQYKKRVADLMKTKSYSKDQIYDIVKKLPMASEAMEKTREQVAEAIWQIYNEDLTAGERREAAHDISEFLVARLMTEAKEENPKAAEANEAIAYLRTGIGRLAFSPEDRAEILHNVDKDGWRRILGRWGFKGKRNKKLLTSEIVV